MGIKMFTADRAVSPGWFESMRGNAIVGPFRQREVEAMDRQAHWQRVYESKDEGEVSWFQERPASSLDLIVRSGIDKSAAIIDVGGGASRLVDHLLDAGYVDVTVLDIADAALAKTRARLGARAEAVGWHAADITEWTPPRHFDLWHDRAVFHFLTEATDRKAYVATMAAAVRVGGQAIIGTFALDGPERCSGMPIRRYDADSLMAEFGQDYRLVETQTEDHVTPGGTVQKFQFCRLRRLTGG